MGQEYNDVTTDIIAKMVSTSGADLSIEQLKTLRDTLEITLSRYNIEEDLTKTEIINLQEENVEHVQRILGHSSVDTTLKCYCKIDKESFKRTYKQYS